jgi:hypothetical protein
LYYLKKVSKMRDSNNKLIAEFMGGIQSSSNIIRLPQTIGESSIFCVKGSEGLPSGTFKVERINELEYDTSWDWLMPVVEKIELLGYTFEKNFQPIDKDWQCLIVKGNDILYQEFNTDSLIACHYVVIEFIKWYNNKNK